MPQSSSAASPSGRRHPLLLLAVAVLGAVIAAAPPAIATWRLPDRAAHPLPALTSAPTGDLPRWRMAFRDDFDGTALDATKWGAYKGGALSGGGTLWDPSHVKVGQGVVTLQGYRDARHGGRWVTAGIGSKRALSQTYGKYAVRMRLTESPGLSFAVLLYPTSNVAPPEIDFAEGFGTSMLRTKASMHHGTKKDRRVVGAWLPVDLRHWHTYGVEWTPGQLTYTIDGRVWSTVRHASVSSVPMVLDIQTQTWDCGHRYHACPSSSSPARMDMQVDWAAAWALSPTASLGGAQRT